MTATQRAVRITWVDADGKAACLGLDETIQTDWTDSECIEAAEYRGQCEGIDLERFHPEIETID